MLALLAGACTEPGPPGPAVAAPPDRTPERVRRALAALTRGWSALPPPPIPARAPAAWAWTGRELLVWASTERGSRELRDGAAYDPEVDSWRPLAQAPLALNQATSAWTGRELLIVGSWLDGNNHSRTPSAAGLGYDPAGDRWRRLDPLPLGEAECYPQSSAAGWFVFAQFCSEHALWDQRSRCWARVGRDLELGAVVAAGPVFLFAGAETGPAGPGSGRLVAYNPG